MANYLLLQGERTLSDELHIANHLARRNGPGHYAPEMDLAAFIDKYYVITWLEEFEDEGLVSDEEFLEQLFEKFNIDRPEDFDSYSMSVGDIVDLNGRIWWCAPIGFTRVN